MPLKALLTKWSDTMQILSSNINCSLFSLFSLGAGGGLSLESGLRSLEAGGEDNRPVLCHKPHSELFF